MTAHVLAALVVAAGVWAAGNAFVAGQPLVGVAATAAAVIALAVWRRTGPPRR